jgi:hypothetical protein
MPCSTSAFEELHCLEKEIDATHGGPGLEMVVAEYDIRAPTTDKLNDTGGDAATEQGHGVTGTTGAS